jgi:hypothetical protein
MFKITKLKYFNRKYKLSEIINLFNIIKNKFLKFIKKTISQNKKTMQ